MACGIDFFLSDLTVRVKWSLEIYSFLVILTLMTVDMANLPTRLPYLDRLDAII